MTRIDIRCAAAPWENQTVDLDCAYDIAYSLSEEYQCDVNLWYNSTNTLYTTVSAYWIMKNYRVQVETYDGCVTVWYEKSKAKSADKLILNRVYNQLCGLNVKEIEVTPSV